MSILYSQAVNSVAMSPGGNSAAVSHCRMNVQIWDLVQRRLQVELPGTAGEGSFLLYSADGKKLVTGEKEVCIWDLTTRPPQQTFAARLPVSTECVALSRDGAMLAAGAGWRDDVTVWDVRTATLRFKLPVRAGYLALSPDGRTLAASNLNPVSLWD